MTDTRLPEQCLLHRDLDGLSDGARQVPTRAMIDCNSQRTGGAVDEIYLRHISPWRSPAPFLEEIIAIGWMQPYDAGQPGQWAHLR